MCADETVSRSQQARAAEQVIPLKDVQLQCSSDSGYDLRRRTLGPVLFQPHDVVDRQPGQGGELFPPQARRAPIMACCDTNISGAQTITPSAQQPAKGFHARVHTLIIARVRRILAGTNSPTVDQGTGWKPGDPERSYPHRLVPYRHERPLLMVATHTLLMTGASRGIGRIAAAKILAGDPTVHLVVVTRGDSGPALARELAEDKHSVSSVSADLSSMVNVRAAATEVAAILDRGGAAASSWFCR